jgi:hypothetical protein
VLHGFCQIDATVDGIISNSLEDLMMKTALRVVEDEFLVEGDWGEELFFQLEVPRLGKHRLYLPIV